MRRGKTRWLGGYVREGKGGRPTFIILKRIGGKLYERSTAAHTERAALAQLERFEEAPEKYDPRGDPETAAIFLTVDLVKPFLEWSRKEKPDGAGNSNKHVNDKKRYVSWWADKLRGVDLRAKSQQQMLRDHIEPALEGQPARAARIAHLKAFYAWLRKKKRLIEAHEDPTFGTLTVPQSSPEQWKRQKSRSQEDVIKVREQLDPKLRTTRENVIRPHQLRDWRPHWDVLSGTAWHVTELQRFARGGEVESATKRQLDEGTDAVLVLWPKNERGSKAGDPLRTAVSADVAEAARQVLGAGSFSREHFDRAVRRACKAAGVEPFTPAQMRHTVLTYALNELGDAQATSSFANHKDPRTQKRFYTVYSTPKRVPTMR